MSEQQTNEKFEELEERFGFGKAVVILEEELSSVFFENLDFQRWLWIFIEASSDNQLKKKALIKAFETVSKFEEAVELYCVVYPDKELMDVILHLMVKYARTFEEWQEVWYRSSGVSDINERAIMEMRKLS